MLDLVNHGGLTNSSADETSFPENLKPAKSEGVTSKSKACLSLSLDVSQISGPDGTSKATPLSQIGFCDPASVGGMQQLTLLSLEVLNTLLSFQFFLLFVGSSKIFLLQVAIDIEVPLDTAHF